ncbi:MAG: GDSL-type esterase/lipase family protein [Phycisphaerales bacterium]
MRKFIQLLFIVTTTLGLLGACATTSKEANKYQPVIDEWVVQDSVDPPPANAVLFIGSSSIRLWDSLHEDFPQYDVIQRGFGGSRFTDANLFIDKIVTPYAPAAIVVFEGTNDIAGGRTAKQVFSDYKTFVKLIRKGERENGRVSAPILFIGITPVESRWKHWPDMKQVNEWVRDYAQKHDNLYYIDTPTPILATAPEPGGPPSRDLFRKDLLHMNPNGYAIWVKVITPELEAVCPPKKADASAGQ